MSREMVMGESPRVVGIVGDGPGVTPGALTRELALAMAAGGVRVLAASLAGADPLEPGAGDGDASGVAWLDLPAAVGSAAGSHHAVRAAIEDAGRDTQRIVLDLGPGTAGAAMLLGPAVDDLLLLLGDGPGAVASAAAYLALLADAWDRDEVHVVVAGADDPETAAARVRELTAATAGAAPCLVPFGVLPSRPVPGTTRAMAEALLRRPVPAVRGGLQFFLEERAGLRRAS